MQNLHRNLILIHLIAFVMLFVIWLAGGAIKTQAGSPLVALYYVLHIFPGSVMFILILFEWLARYRGTLGDIAQLPWHLRLNRRLHRLYYLILLALPVTGIVIFFESSWMLQATQWLPQRPVYQLHSSLFDVLMVLVLVNLVAMTVGCLRERRLG
jgi:cytochrome b561